MSVREVYWSIFSTIMVLALSSMRDGLEVVGERTCQGHLPGTLGIEYARYRVAVYVKDAAGLFFLPTSSVP